MDINAVICRLDRMVSHPLIRLDEHDSRSLEELFHFT